MILACVIAFVSGAAYQACCVGFIHFSESGRPFLASLCAMAEATSTVAGIGESVVDLRAAPFFVLGHGVGTYAAVAWKTRKAKS